MSDWGWSSIFDLWTGFASWSPTPQAFYAMLVTSVLSALLLSRFMGGIPMATIPASFVLLLFCSRISNYACAGIHLTAVGEFEKAAAFSAMGHVIAGVMLLAIFGVREGQRKTGF